MRAGTLGFGINADSTLINRTFEFDDARSQCKEREVVAFANVFARMELRPALANDDRAGLDDLARVLLNAESLGIGVATVSG